MGGQHRTRSRRLQGEPSRSDTRVVQSLCAACRTRPVPRAGARRPARDGTLVRNEAGDVLEIPAIAGGGLPFPIRPPPEGVVGPEALRTVQVRRRHELRTSDAARPTLPMWEGTLEAPDVLERRVDGKAESPVVPVTGIEAPVPGVACTPGGVVRVLSLGDPDHRGAPEPLQLFPVEPMAAAVRTAEAVGRQEDASRVPIVHRGVLRQVDEDGLGVTLVRIAPTARSQPALAARPPAVPQVGRQVGEPDAALDRLGTHEVATSQPARGRVPVAGSRRRHERGRESAKERGLAGVGEAVPVGVQAFGRTGRLQSEGAEEREENDHRTPTPRGCRPTGSLRSPIARPDRQRARTLADSSTTRPGF